MAKGLNSFLNDLVLVTQRVVETDRPMTPSEMLSHLREYVEHRDSEIDIILTPLTVTPSKDKQIIYPKVGEAYSSVTVNEIPKDVWMEIPTAEKTINENGKYNVTEFANVDIQVNTLFNVDESGVLYVTNGSIEVDDSGSLAVV